MDIKTKGFSMPDGNTHIFIPPAPTETDRGGITAKPRTTEAAEVVVDSGTGKGYIGTDHTLKEKGQAADSEAVGIAISEKADRIISSASGENVILTDSAEAPLQGLKVFGRSTQDGEPSSDNQVPIVSVGDKGNIELEVTGRNLIPNNYKARTYNGITYTVLDDGSVLLNGTANESGSTLTLWLKPDFEHLENLWLSGGKDNSIKVAYSNWTDRAYTSNGKEIMIPKQFDYSKYPNARIQVEVDAGTTANNVLIKPMLNSGDSALPFEPYHTPQSLTLSTPNGLPGIKVDSGGNYTDSDGQQWICDRIVDKNGVIGIERHIAKKVLTGLEWWSVDERQNENNGVFFTGMPESGKGDERVLCNRFLWKRTTDIYGTIDTKYHQFRFYAENRTITVDEWKRFVANNNIEIYYQLQKPTFEPLPQSEQDAIKALHTNNPTTVISNDESAHIEVTYAADTKNYILNREKAMQKQISDIQAALISQKISGGGIKITDSAKMPLQGLKVFGRSEQVVTKGYQLFDASKLPTKTQGGATVTNNGDGSFTISGSRNLTDIYSNTHTYSNAETKQLLRSGILTLKCDKTSVPYCYVSLRNSKGPVAEINNKTNISSSYMITEENIKDTTFQMTIGFYGGKSSGIVPNSIKPMIYQEGDGTWEPFTGGKTSPSPDNPSPIESVGDEGNVNIEVTGRNLFDYETWSKKNIPCKRGTISFIDDGILIKATENDAYMNFNGEDPFVKIPVNPKDVLELSWESDNNLSGAVYIFPNANTDGMTLGDNKNEKKIQYTVPPSGVSFISFRFGVAVAGESILYKNIMLRKVTENDIRVKYEPYRALQSLTLSTPNGLPGVKVDSGGNYTDLDGQQWICDEIDLERGKYVKRILYHQYNKTTDAFNKSPGALEQDDRFSVDIGFKTCGNKCIMTNMQRADLWGTGENSAGIGNTSGQYCFIRFAGITNIENLDALLQKTPLSLFVGLKSPIEYDLTPEEIAAYKALHTEHPTTIFTNDENAEMELTYTVDTKTYVDKKIAEISTAIMQKGN